MTNIRNISAKKITWYDIIQPSSKSLQFLKNKFKFEDEDILESLPSRQAERPRLEVRPQYLFLVTLFPSYNYDTRSIQEIEVDVFITRDHLFTIHNKQIGIINDLFHSLEQNKNLRESYLNDRPSFLFYEVLDALYHGIGPMLDHVSKDIKDIEKNIFEGREREMLHELLITKTNILNFKRIMQSHRGFIKKLLAQDVNYLGNEKAIKLYYTELLNHATEIWDVLQTYGEFIESLENTNNTILGLKTNKDIKKLTVLTLFIFVIGIFTGIFGMNATATPIVGMPYDFWVILGLMAAALLIVYLYIRKKRII